MIKLSFYKLLFLGCLTFLICACQKTNDTNSVAGVQFFDLKDYFQQEQERLSNKSKVKKKVTIDGKVEEKVVEDYNAIEELSIFIDSDINKVSWIDKYEVDSIFENQQLMQVNYQALDENMKTNWLSIHFNESRVDSISIIRKTSSLAAELEQQLDYVPAKGFTIISSQQTTFSETNVLRLDVFYDVK